MAKVDRIKEIMPDCGISADIIAGFCTETEEDHQETLAVMQHAQYDYSYMYFYSERPGTLAAKRFEDDVPEAIKKRRLQEIIELQNRMSLESNRQDLGKVFEVLVEGESKRTSTDLKGRNSRNKVIIFPKEQYQLKAGDYVQVLVESCTQGTLIGKIVAQ